MAFTTRPPLALALVIDTSGCMREFADRQSAPQAFNPTLQTKMEQAIAGAHALIDDDRLTPEDQVTVIQFDDNASTLLPLTPLSNRQAAHQVIESLRHYSGKTYMAKGMRGAQRELSDLPPQVAKRVLLLTDGQTFAEPECSPLAGQFAEANAPIIAIGIGAEYKELARVQRSGL